MTRVDNYWIYILGWTRPLKLYQKKTKHKHKTYKKSFHSVHSNERWLLCTTQSTIGRLLVWKAPIYLLKKKKNPSRFKERGATSGGATRLIMLTVSSVSDRRSSSLFPPGLSPYDQCWQQPCDNTLPTRSSHSAKLCVAILRKRRFIQHTQEHFTVWLHDTTHMYSMQNSLPSVRTAGWFLWFLSARGLSEVYISLCCSASLRHFTTGGHKVGLSNTYRRPAGLF